MQNTPENDPVLREKRSPAVVKMRAVKKTHSGDVMRALSEIISQLPVDEETRERCRAAAADPAGYLRALPNAVAPAAPMPANVVSFPVCRDSARAVSNILLRCALFGAIKRGRRGFRHRFPLAGPGNNALLVTGIVLDQADRDVWDAVIHLHRGIRPGDRVLIPAHQILKIIGRSTGKSDIEWLKGALSRLQSTVIEASDGRYAYSGPMIMHWVRDDETGHQAITLNPKIAELYGADGWTAVEHDQRMAIKGKVLAQWLHSFFSSHAKPFPIKLDTIKALCGSETKEKREFRRQLKGALSDLSEATSWKCSLDDADLIHVEKL